MYMEININLPQNHYMIINRRLVTCCLCAAYSISTLANPLPNPLPDNKAGIATKLATFQFPGVKLKFVANLICITIYTITISVMSNFISVKYSWCTEGLQILMQLPVYCGILFDKKLESTESNVFSAPIRIMKACDIPTNAINNIIASLRIFIMMFGGLSLCINIIHLFAPYRAKILPNHSALAKVINAITPTALSPSTPTVASQFLGLISAISPVSKFFASLFLECAPFAVDPSIAPVLITIRLMKGYVRLGYKV